MEIHVVSEVIAQIFTKLGEKHIQLTICLYLEVL